MHPKTPKHIDECGVCEQGFSLLGIDRRFLTRGPAPTRAIDWTRREVQVLLDEVLSKALDLEACGRM